MVYILSEVRLKRDFVDNSMESAVIQQAIRNSQDIFLRSIIGDYLLDTLEDMIENDTLTGEYKLLVDDYCIPYLEFRTMAELQMSSFKLNNAGVNQVHDSNISTLSVEQVKYLEQQYINRASYYENRMTKFLLQSGIPEYKMNTGITNASTTITEQTGLYLGGTKTKTTSKTAKANPQLEGVVRYDTYQRLTDEERRQIRENAGMYNYDDNNQFDNTKYYTKQQVNKIVDDIPIPQFTSELELDNVYSKQQVDTLIAEIPTFSGDYEDLTNKPSIYTKEETDTLISNIKGFSGDYNDLTNKPDVYTKTETDTAIQNAVDGIETFSGNYNDLTNKPTLFSGSYTDLSDKPTIPTKTSDLTLDTVYSKSETDTAIQNAITETIGDINNILNTI